MADPQTRLLAAATAVADAISFDCNGVLLPTGYQGGNGGLLSKETIARTDELRRAIAAAEAAASAPVVPSPDELKQLLSACLREKAEMATEYVKTVERLSAPAEPAEPVAWVARIGEVLDEGDGFWRSCSGCHELNDGVPTGDYSAAFRAHAGLGCSECGGLGVVWDVADYGDMADFLARETAIQPPSSPQAWTPALSATLRGLEAKAVAQKDYFARKQRDLPCLEDITDGAGNLSLPDDISPLLQQAEANGRYSEADWWLSTIRAAIAAAPPVTLDPALRDALEAEINRLKKRLADASYMAQAYSNMLGEKGLAVAKGWSDRGVQRVHYDWGPEAAKLSGEERAQAILDMEAAVDRSVSAGTDEPPRTEKPAVDVKEFVAALAAAQPGQGG